VKDFLGGGGKDEAAIQDQQAEGGLEEEEREELSEKIEGRKEISLLILCNRLEAIVRLY
jgi:hypothetical protein